MSDEPISFDTHDGVLMRLQELHEAYCAKKGYSPADRHLSIYVLAQWSIRSLIRERDEARNAALEEAALHLEQSDEGISGEFDYAAAKIRALKT